MNAFRIYLLHIKNICYDVLCDLQCKQYEI